MDLIIHAGGQDIPVSINEALQLDGWLRASGLSQTSKEFNDAMSGARAARVPQDELAAVVAMVEERLTNLGPLRSGVTLPTLLSALQRDLDDAA
jgi:hypothetical protein